jgi:hypothetical protein
LDNSTTGPHGGRGISKRKSNRLSILRYSRAANPERKLAIWIGMYRFNGLLMPTVWRVSNSEKTSQKKNRR